ncbi:keratin, type II cytoskeletal 1-like isoform X2 [Photinus pyralis]|uniref:keratin, type II cytoskeletal 1-like isoform X2 n=1 Tax=Photinus pyralis TaxID=7054 RepID=UPI001266F989|nr:keratin, type II cytoskeletal 1-like isoform X2 [Photinus pyralis]
MRASTTISFCVILTLASFYDGVNGHFGGGGRHGGGHRGGGRHGGGHHGGGHHHGGFGGHGHHGGGGHHHGGHGHHGGGGHGDGGQSKNFFSAFIGFLSKFPMFANINTQSRSEAINLIISIFKQQPSIMKDIFVYLQGTDVSTRDNILAIFKDLLRGSGLDISVLVNGGSAPSNKVQFDLASLFPGNPKTQAQIQIYLDGLSQDEQKKISVSLANLKPDAQIEYLLQLSGANSGQGGQVVINGGGGNQGSTNIINIQKLFPTEPQLQSEIQVFLNGLDQQTRSLILSNLGQLDINTQIQVFRQLIELSQTPGAITITINGVPITINNKPQISVVGGGGRPGTPSIPSGPNGGKKPEISIIGGGGNNGGGYVPSGPNGGQKPEISIIGGGGNNGGGYIPFGPNGGQKPEISIIGGGGNNGGGYPSGPNGGQKPEISIIGGGGNHGTTNIINLQKLFPTEPQMQSEIQVFLNGLDQQTQNLIFSNLGQLDMNTQIQIFRQLIELSHTPGIITITINGVPIKIDNSGHISMNGGGGGHVTANIINLHKLFPADPEMQSQIQVFLNGLDQETQNLIYSNIGQLDINSQIQIFRQLIELSHTPGIITITINGVPIKITNM